MCGGVAEGVKVHHVLKQHVSEIYVNSLLSLLYQGLFLWWETLTVLWELKTVHISKKIP